MRRSGSGASCGDGPQWANVDIRAGLKTSAKTKMTYRFHAQSWLLLPAVICAAALATMNSFPAAVRPTWGKRAVPS